MCNGAIKMPNCNKHVYQQWNGGRNRIELQYSSAAPNSFTASTGIWLKSEESDCREVLNKILAKHKKHLEYYLNCEKSIIIFDIPKKIEQGKRFWLNLDIAGLTNSRMSKSILVDKGDTMKEILNSMYQELNANWITRATPMVSRKKEKK